MAPDKKSTLKLGIAAALAALISGGGYLYINLFYTDGFLTLPLDDAYIFLHYARNFAQGHPLEYNVGDPPTTGVTSYLYLLILTPLALVFPGADQLVWAAFAVNVVLYGANVFLFGKIIQKQLDGQYTLPATAAFAACGPVTFHSFAGMDAGVFIFTLLFALWAFGQAQDKNRFGLLAGALALLAAARPEGIAAAAVVAAFALAGKGRGTPWKRKVVVIAGLAPVPVYFLVNYLATGYTTPQGFLSKSIWAPASVPAIYRLGEVLRFFFFVIKDVLMGLAGTYQRAVHNLNIPDAAAGVFPPLSLVLFVLGWGRAARRSWAAGTATPAFLAGTVFLVGVVLSCFFLPYPRHFLRYLTPFFPLFIVGVLAGVDGVAALIRYGRPTISHRALVYAGLAYVLTFGLASSIYAWVAYGLATRDIRLQHINVARFIRNNLPTDATVFTHDVGAIAYYGRHRVVDIEGLVTRETWRNRTEGEGAAAASISHYGKPGDYFAGYLTTYGFDECGMLEKPAYEARLFAVTIAGGETMTVARLTPVVFKELRPPAPPGPAFTLRDEVDVGDVLSEEAHGYRQHRRGGHLFPTLATVGTVQGFGEAFETGRPICGAEEFDVRAVGETVLAVRCMPPFRADVHVDGKFIGRWEIPPAGRKDFVDGYFHLPMTVKRRVFRVRLNSVGEDLDSFNTVLHYYIFSRGG